MDPRRFRSPRGPGRRLRAECLRPRAQGRERSRSAARHDPHSDRRARRPREPTPCGSLPRGAHPTISDADAAPGRPRCAFGALFGEPGSRSALSNQTSVRTAKARSNNLEYGPRPVKLVLKVVLNSLVAPRSIEIGTPGNLPLPERGLHPAPEVPVNVVDH